MEITELNKRKIFKHSHELNVCTNNLSALALDIFYTIISQIKNEDTEFNLYKVKITDLEEALNTKEKEERPYQLNRKSLESACEILMNQKVRLTTEDKTEILQWFNRSVINIKDQTIELELSSHLKDHLLNLQKYVKGDLTSFLKLKSVYSKKIYTLACQFKSTGFLIKSVNDLNEILDTPDSLTNNYSDFKRRVLIQAQEDINDKTDLKISFSEIKTKKAVTEIKFLIKEKKTKETKIKEKNNVVDSKKQLIETIDKSEYDLLMSKLNELKK